MELLKKNNKGYLSIVGLLIVFAILIIGLFMLNNYMYLQSYRQIDKEIDSVSDIIAKNGGLPSKDLNYFNNRLLKYSFIYNHKEAIKISLKSTDTNTDCLNTSPLKDETNYISSDDKENMILKVTVPSNVDTIMNNVLDVFSLNKLSSTYSYERLIVSQREIPKDDTKEDKISNKNTETDNGASVSKQIDKEPTENTSTTESNTNETDTVKHNEEESEPLAPPIIETAEEPIINNIN